VTVLEEEELFLPRLRLLASSKVTGGNRLSELAPEGGNLRVGLVAVRGVGDVRDRLVGTIRTVLSNRWLPTCGREVGREGRGGEGVRGGRRENKK